MWKLAVPENDLDIVELSLSLFREDPSTETVTAEQILRTLLALREAPTRGVALVLELEGQTLGYALLIAFWSNELGGEVHMIDEIYVDAQVRGQGHGRALMVDLLSGYSKFGLRQSAAFQLEVSPKNTRARKLYESLGFIPVRNTHLRWRGST